MTKLHSSTVRRCQTSFSVIGSIVLALLQWQTNRTGHSPRRKCIPISTKNFVSCSWKKLWSQWHIVPQALPWSGNMLHLCCSRFPSKMLHKIRIIIYTWRWIQSVIRTEECITAVFRIWTHSVRMSVRLPDAESGLSLKTNQGGRSCNRMIYAMIISLISFSTSSDRRLRNSTSRDGTQAPQLFRWRPSADSHYHFAFLVISDIYYL